MSNSQERSRMCMENSKSLTNDLFDPETGQVLFHPKVGRGPRQRSRQRNPSEQLYENALKLREKKEAQIRQSRESLKKQSSTMHSRSRTNRIVERQKQQTFSKIFELLDSDGDGQISAYKIDISALDADLLQILTPLFVEMEELGETLDRDEFIDAAKRLYDSLNLADKNILIKRDSRLRSSSARARSQSMEELERAKN